MNVSAVGGMLPSPDSAEAERRLYLLMRRRGHWVGLHFGPRRGKPHITLKVP